MNKPEYNLMWGEPVIVRQALVETLRRSYGFGDTSLYDSAYPPHYGSSKLIEQMRGLAERQSGKKPKHLFVTCGATGAINAGLFALKTVKTDWLVTEKRYFPLYPSISNVADLVMVDDSRKSELLKSGLEKNNFIVMKSSPSNPEGLVFPYESLDIWDAAYSSKTYTKGGHVPLNWSIMCGSLSKTLGLAGLRLGWIGTNNDELANSIGSWITANSAGQSSASMVIAEDILSNLNLERFEQRSALYIDQNREEMQKILSKFGQGDVPSRGMFAILQLGKSERKAMEKANVKWLPGNMWGESDEWARLSLGLSREVVREAVKEVIK